MSNFSQRKLDEFKSFQCNAKATVQKSTSCLKALYKRSFFVTKAKKPWLIAQELIALIQLGNAAPVQWPAGLMRWLSWAGRELTEMGRFFRCQLEESTDVNGEAQLAAFKDKSVRICQVWTTKMGKLETPSRLREEATTLALEPSQWRVRVSQKHHCTVSYKHGTSPWFTCQTTLLSLIRNPLCVFHQAFFL